MKSSLREKIIQLNMMMIAVTVVLVAVLAALQYSSSTDLMEKASQNQREVIVDTMADSMQEFTTESLQKHVVSETKLIDEKFRSMEHDLEILAGQVKKALKNPAAYASAEVLPPSREKAGRISAQLLFSDRADPDDPELRERILQISGLTDLMMTIVEDSDAMQDCVISLPGGASIIVDDEAQNKIGPDGEPLFYNVYRRPWYVGAQVHRKAYFTPVSQDLYSGNYEVMAGQPVLIGGKLAAACGASISIDSMAELIVDAEIGEYTDACIINETGNLIFSTRDSGELGSEGIVIKSMLDSGNVELVALVEDALKGRVGFSLLTVDGEETYIAYAPIETLGWAHLLCVPKDYLNETAYLLSEQVGGIMDDSIAELRGSGDRSAYMLLGAAIMIFGLALLLSGVFSKQLTDPINTITQRVSGMQGDMVFEMDEELRTGDEIEVLAQSFADMSEKMQGYIQEIVQITSEKQRIDTELSIAADIQLNMLPKNFPAFPERKEFDLYAVMDPAREVGGDFYDFFLIDDDHLALVMADVSGKGVPAAMFMMTSKTLIMNTAQSGQYGTPGEILTAVNARLSEGNDDGMFVTAWLGILTISTGELVSACAGHEYPVFYRKGLGFIMERDHHGVALGAAVGLKYRDDTWQLNPGDMLFLYTDGVTEANNSERELFGTKRMMAALEKSRQLTIENGGAEQTDLQLFLRTMREQVDAFVGDTPQFDDLTMLCLEYRG